MLKGHFPPDDMIAAIRCRCGRGGLDEIPDDERRMLDYFLDDTDEPDPELACTFPACED